MGEARVPARARPLPVVDVVADGAGQRVVVARQPGQRAPDELVGGARAVGVGGQHGVDLRVGRQQRLEARLVELLAEAHEAPAAPGPQRRVSDRPRHAGDCSPADFDRREPCRRLNPR